MLRSPSVSGLRAPEAPPPHLARIAVQLQQITVEICTARGGGSGILWARDLVVTNAHVTRAACVAVGFADERRAEARLLAADVRADLALFQIPPVAVTPAVLADSDALRVGDLVVALGNPLRLRRTITAGVVHALSRSGERCFIHADLRLAPGNSGGPLADAAGAVVGVNTMIAGGLAVAIPVNDVRRFVASALSGGA